MNSSKGLLTIIAVVLIAIFIVIAMQYHRENRSPIEKISDGISETSQEIGDEIDDHTDARQEDIMRGILLWALGIPIPVIILIYFLFQKVRALLKALSL